MRASKIPTVAVLVPQGLGQPPKYKLVLEGTNHSLYGGALFTLAEVEQRGIVIDNADARQEQERNAELYRVGKMARDRMTPKAKEEAERWRQERLEEASGARRHHPNTAIAPMR